MSREYTRDPLFLLLPLPPPVGDCSLRRKKFRDKLETAQQMATTLLLSFGVSLALLFYSLLRVGPRARARSTWEFARAPDRASFDAELKNFPFQVLLRPYTCGEQLFLSGSATRGQGEMACAPEKSLSGATLAYFFSVTGVDDYRVTR